MSTGAEQPPADWYTDPYDDTLLRYWDGTAWTEHRHPRQAGVPDVSGFLEKTFRVAWSRVVPGLYLSACLALPAGLMNYLMTRILLANLVISPDGVEGVTASRVILAAVCFVAGQILSGMYWVALGHQLYWGHRGHAVAATPWPQSLRAGLRRGPFAMAVLWAVGVVGYMAAIFAIVIAALAFAPLLAIVIPLALAAVVFGLVKLAFLFVAAAANPSGVGALRASASVSAGRFWLLLGRLVILMVIVVIIGLVVSSVTTPFAGGYNVDLIGADTVDFRELVPGPVAGLVAAVIGAFLGLASVGVLLSGLAALYNAVGAPASEAPD